MTTTNPRQNPQFFIAAAIEDWWVCTDPAAPFDPQTVARQVEEYLLGAGYYIAPDALDDNGQRSADLACAVVAAPPASLDPAAVLESAATALDAQTCTCGCRRGAEFLRDRAAVLRAALDTLRAQRRDCCEAGYRTHGAEHTCDTGDGR